MSLLLESPSRDLRRLVDEGYEIRIEENYLVLGHVPFLNASGVVEFGELISELLVSGNETLRPDPHTVYFTGVPHDTQGRPLDKIIAAVLSQVLTPTLTAATYLSSKPQIGYYSDYHAKMTQYAKMIWGWAQAVNPDVTARTYRPVIVDETESVFNYLDSASSRAGITELTGRLARGPVAIIGLGGTGSYLLDLLAKTPVEQIHLWDSDVFSAHNAFRAPGAASVDELNARPLKVDYYSTIYSQMRRGISPHPRRIEEENVSELAGMSFVFVCMDAGPSKRVIVEYLIRKGISFIDTGMGVQRQGDALGGVVRVTTSADGRHDHILNRVSFADEQHDEYDRNIQIAELNSLNATMAIIKWKKLMGFYLDHEKELHSTYTVSGNFFANSESSE